MFWIGKNNKLLLTVGALLVVGFLLTSHASFFVSRVSLRSQISLNDLPLTSDNIYSEIQRDLLRPVFISSVMATDTFLRDWVIGGEVGEQHIIKYLREIQREYNMFTSFFVSEKTRTYYHSNGKLKTVSPDEQRDTWYFRLKDMQDDYEINVDPDLANKDAMTIFINYRVFDYEKNFIGVTGVGLTVRSVKNLIELYQQKYNRTIYFIDKDGEVKLAGSGFDIGSTNLSQQEHFPLFKEKFGLENPSSFTYKKGGDVIHTNIRHIDELNWYLVVEQSEQQAIQNIFTVLFINIVISLAVSAAVLLLVALSIRAYKKRLETLRGIVPICSFCKQIRDDKGYWNKVEEYVAKHTEAEFTHGVCPDCAKKHYGEFL
jgi:hypothetical protein